MTTFFILAVIVLVAVLYLTRAKKESVSKNWFKFFSKGKEAGFSIRELEQIRRLSNNCNIKDPVSIFTSQTQLENCIRSVVNTVRMSGESEDPGMQDFLSRLFDYCNEVGIKNSEKKSSITNSRQISEGQTLRILVSGTGVFKSEVIKNVGNYLTIARPSNEKATSSMQWTGMRISIYFWREDDAGYVFDTEVIDEVFSKGISSLKVEHNDSLFRTQKRRSLRAKIRKPAYVYMLNEANQHRMETAAGLRCMLDDISDKGCAFRVNGQAVVGLRLKVQFALDRIPICIPGTVRSVEYQQKANKSLVHMEADTLPTSVRNHIMCEVFDMLPDEDDDELPFRVTEDKADEAPQPEAKNDEQNYQEAVNE